MSRDCPRGGGTTPRAAEQPDVRHMRQVSFLCPAVMVMVDVSKAVDRAGESRVRGQMPYPGTSLADLVTLRPLRCSDFDCALVPGDCNLGAVGPSSSQFLMLEIIGGCSHVTLGDNVLCPSGKAGHV